MPQGDQPHRKRERDRRERREQQRPEQRRTLERSSERDEHGERERAELRRPERQHASGLRRPTPLLEARRQWQGCGETVALHALAGHSSATEPGAHWSGGLDHREVWSYAETRIETFPMQMFPETALTTWR
jgi:hypothetical protein